MNSSEQVLQHFDAVAPAYAKGQWARWLKIWESRALKRFLPRDFRQRRILDIGSGDGFHWRQVGTQTTTPITAVDLSSEMLSRLPKGLNAIRGAVESVEFPPHAFDLLLLLGVLEFLSWPREALSRLSSWAAPGAQLLLLTPRRNWAGALYRRYHYRHALQVRLFDGEELAQWLSAEGWSLKRQDHVHPFAQLQLFEKV